MPNFSNTEKREEVIFSESFEEAFYKTKVHEGGYRSAETARKHGDPGGETYMGISREKNSGWEGWKTIDKYRETNTLKYNRTIPNNPKLDYQLKTFFKEKYWDHHNLDKVKNLDTAAMLFDIAVNKGNRRMVDFVRENTPQGKKSKKDNAKHAKDAKAGKAEKTSPPLITKLNQDQIDIINKNPGIHDKIVKTRDEFTDRNLSKRSDYAGLKKRIESTKEEQMFQDRTQRMEQKRLLEKKLHELSEKGHQLASHRHSGNVCTGADCSHTLQNISGGINKLMSNLKA